KRKDHGLEREMRGILREKGLREEDPYEKVIARAIVIDESSKNISYKQLVKKASELLSDRIGLDEDELNESFYQAHGMGTIPIGNGATINHTRIDKNIPSEMVLVRIPEEIVVSNDGFEVLNEQKTGKTERLNAIFFLFSSFKKYSQHI